MIFLFPQCVSTVIIVNIIIISSSSVFSSVFAITKRSEMGLYDVPMFMSLFDFGIGMMFASIHV